MPMAKQDVFIKNALLKPGLQGQRRYSFHPEGIIVMSIVTLRIVITENHSLYTTLRCGRAETDAIVNVLDLEYCQ